MQFTQNGLREFMLQSNNPFPTCTEWIDHTTVKWQFVSLRGTGVCSTSYGESTHTVTNINAVNDTASITDETTIE